MLSAWVNQSGARTAQQAAEEGLAREKQEAERLGVAYPEKKCKVGRVSRQTLYSELIVRKIRTHRWAELAELTDSVVPEWWQKGMDLSPPEGMVRAAHAAVAAQEAQKKQQQERELQEQQQEEAADAQPSKKAKKEKLHISRVLQIWFLSWYALMAASHKYSLYRCSELAAVWMPETFGRIHKDTPRKWEPLSAQEKAAAAAPPPPPSRPSVGRPKALSEEQGRKLAAVVHELVEGGTAVSTALVRGLVQEDFGIKVSGEWTRQFLKDIGLSHKAAARTSAPLRAEDARAAQRHLRAKLIHSMTEHGVGWDQIYNLDETACHLLPMPTRAWTVSGRSSKGRWRTDKQVVTCTLVASPEGGDVLCQLLFEGSTRQCLPQGPAPQNQAWSYSPTHWANSGTLLEVMEQIECEVKRRSGGALVNYIVLLDVAPSHCSDHFLHEVATKHVRARLVFVAPGTTACCQPLDIAYMRSFKASLRDIASRAFAQQILQGTSAHGQVLRKPELKLSLSGLVAASVQRLQRGTHHLAGWSHLYVESEDEWA